MEEELRSQILVVGSGPGGSVIADELQGGGLEVLMVEEGPELGQSSATPYSASEMVQKYRHGGVTAAFGNPRINYIEGRCLGGGSEINSGLYVRTPEMVLERWRKEYDVLDLTQGCMEEHFRSCEVRANVCKMPGGYPEISRRLLEGATLLGWRCIEVPRCFRYADKPDPLPLEGARQSMSETRIPSFIKNGGSIRTGIRVLSVGKSRSSWKASAIRTVDGAQVGIIADKIVIAAGAIQTPVILRRSGITRNVGNNLKLHATIKVIAEFADEVNNELTGVAVHQVNEFYPDQTYGCAVSSPAYLKLGLLDNPDFEQNIGSVWKRMGSYYVMISGGVGKVRAVPFTGEALVTYGIGKKGLLDLALGQKRLSQLLFRAGAIRIFPGIRRSLSLRNVSEIHRLPNVLERSTARLMTIHLMGSCPMGENKDKCAVDSFGRVNSADGLYVSDASLIGADLGVNPQATIMALSRRNARHLLGGH